MAFRIESTETVAAGEITSHKVNGLNESLRIAFFGKPGSGGAYHNYCISQPNLGKDCKPNSVNLFSLKFQEGPIQEAGINGISNEALLAIVEHRLECFQNGLFKCRENAVALTKLQECIMWLQKRTRDRVARGVEGTSTV